MERKRSQTVWGKSEIKRLTSIRGYISENRKKILLKQQPQGNESLSEYLNKPEKEELPRILELRRDSFYKGNAGKNVKDWSSGVRRMSKELSKEEDNLIEMNQFFKKPPGRADLKRGMRVMLVGPAGSGKTTICGRLAREASNGSIDEMKEDGFLIHQVNCRELNPNEKISVSEFLFKTMLCKDKMSKEDIELGYRWMQENPEKIGLIIDSLDTMKFRLEKVERVIGPDDLATPDVILYNLLVGNLFYESLVLASSREYKIKGYKGDLRADKILSLVGLREDSISSLTIGFLGETEGKRVFNELKKHPGLMELCETPVFLIFTLIGLKQKNDASAFVPKTVAGVLVNLVNCLSRSEHARTRESFSHEKFITAINRMKDLAYNGMKNDRVLYNEKDLKDALLTEEDISDLAVIIPGRRKKLQQILERGELGALSFFIHQTIGELLCALKICEMSLEKFREFVADDLHQRKLSVVRWIICGILLDDEVFKEASQLLLQSADAEFEEKRKSLRESLTRQFHKLVKEEDRPGLLDLLHAINEARDGVTEIVPPNVDKISVSYQPLTASDVFAVAGSTSRCSRVNKLALIDCCVYSETVEGLHDRLQHSDLKVTELDVSENGTMHAEGLSFLGRFVERHEVRKLGLESCEIKPKELDSFCDGLGEAKLREVTIWQYLPLPIQAICKLQSKVTGCIDLRGNRLSEEGEEMLQEKLNELYPTNLKILVGGHDSSPDVKVLRSVKKSSQAASPHMEVGVTALEEDEEDFQKGFETLEKEFVVEPSGGILFLEEASIFVHKTSFSDPLIITLSMSMDFRDLGLCFPEDQVPISPIMGVELKGGQQISSTMKAPTWFQSCDPNITLRVYKGTIIDGSRVWSEFQAEVKLDDGYLEFETSHFCCFIVTVWRWARGTSRVTLNHTLLTKGDNFRAVVCYQKPAMLMNEKVKKLEHEGYVCVYDGCFVMFTAKGTRVPVIIEGDKKKYTFDPASRELTPKRFDGGIHTVSLTFLLKCHGTQRPNEVKIRYKVKDDDAVMSVDLLPDTGLPKTTCSSPTIVLDHPSFVTARYHASGRGRINSSESGTRSTVASRHSTG